MGFRRAARLIERSAYLDPGAYILTDPGTNHLQSLNDAAAIAGQVGLLGKAQALEVPAIAQGVQIITRLFQLPLVAWTGDQLIQVPSFLAQPDPDTVPATTYGDTGQDLVFYGRAYWQVLEWQPEAPNIRRRPRYARHIPYTDVEPDVPGVSVMVDGVRHAVMSSRYDASGSPAVIAFDGPLAGGILAAGQTAISTALTLERLARRFAAQPAPQGNLVNTSAYDLTDTEVDDVLARYVAGRQRFAVGYLGGGMKYESASWNAAELQLVEARQASDARMAQLLNLPADYVNAPSQSSMTYSNVESRRRDLYDLTFATYSVPFEQRLSQSDVSAATIRITHDVSQFYRADMASLITMGQQATAAGLLDVAEWRAMAGLPGKMAP